MRNSKNKFSNVAKILIALAVVVFGDQILSIKSAGAEETTVNKVQDQVGDAKVGTKKLARKVRRKVRNATGNESVIKDVKDVGNDAADDISNTANKIKRK